ncbi:hypothetical protein K1719_002367 [Acacia pycnantha]|nr:hypothetical protein K1719_002367 [Acacia pycnantha]
MAMVLLGEQGEQKLQVPSLTEEDDLLARSSKKVIKVVQREYEYRLGGHWLKLGEIPSSYNVGGLSFVYKLKGTCNEEDEKEGVGDKGTEDLSVDCMSEGSVEILDRQKMQRKYLQGREKVSGKNTAVKSSREEEVVVKIVEGAVMVFVQQEDRSLEKRSREGDNFFYWNSREACASGLFRNLKTSLNGTKPSLLVLADTKCQDVSRLRCLLRLGYDSVVDVPSEGRSGGIVMIWNSSLISILVLKKDRQFIHVRCSGTGISDFLLMSVYALPHSRFRAVLWKKLKPLVDRLICPGLYGGILMIFCQSMRGLEKLVVITEEKIGSKTERKNVI